MITFEDQAKEIFDIWPTHAEWFICGGPGDSNEMSTVKAAYPDIKCLGIEPNPDYVRKQRDAGFYCIEAALWSRQTALFLSTPEGYDGRSASVCRPDPAPDVPAGRQIAKTGYIVQTVSLDYLSAKVGPFTNVVLWIDIEYAELEALMGARELLESGQILLINLETFDRYRPGIDEYLKQYGLKFLRKWNIGLWNPEGHDAIYVRDQ